MIADLKFRISVKKAGKLYFAHQDFINRTIDFVAEKKKLSSAWRDEFECLIHDELMKDDFRRIRKIKDHANNSVAEAYLSVVINNLARDFLTKMLGKWPSDKAGKIGQPAIFFEKLLNMHNYPFDEAVYAVQSRFELLFLLNKRSRERLEEYLIKDVLLKLNNLRAGYLYTEEELDKKLSQLLERKLLELNQKRIKESLKIDLTRRMMESWGISKRKRGKTRHFSIVKPSTGEEESRLWENSFPASSETPEEMLFLKEAAETIKQLEKAVQKIIQSLGDEEWMIFKARFQSGMSVSKLVKLFNKSRYKIGLILKRVLRIFEEECRKLDIEFHEIQEVLKRRGININQSL